MNFVSFIYWPKNQNVISCIDIVFLYLGRNNEGKENCHKYCLLQNISFDKLTRITVCEIGKEARLIAWYFGLLKRILLITYTLFKLSDLADQAHVIG